VAARFEHVSITVSNLDRSIAFYRDLIGLELKQVGEVDAPYIGEIVGVEGTSIRLAEFHLHDGLLLELFEYRSPSGQAVRPRTWDPGATHIAFQVDDIDAFWSRLKEAGVETRSDDPIVIDDPRWYGVRCAYFSDPDGVTIEVSAPAIGPG
jgi:catechol 2,3-dioxygenase-like lactoylglutathione lyase family enzyme